MMALPFRAVERLLHLDVANHMAWLLLSPVLALDTGAVPSGVASVRRGPYLVLFPSPRHGLMGSGLSQSRARWVRIVLHLPSSWASVGLAAQVSPLALVDGLDANVRLE